MTDTLVSGVMPCAKLHLKIMSFSVQLLLIQQIYAPGFGTLKKNNKCKLLSPGILLQYSSCIVCILSFIRRRVKC